MEADPWDSSDTVRAGHEKSFFRGCESHTAHRAGVHNAFFSSYAKKKGERTVRDDFNLSSMRHN